MKNTLPWLLTAAVALGTPLLLASGYKPQARDLGVTELTAGDRDAAAAREQEFARRAMVP